MASIPHPFVSCDKTTTQNDACIVTDWSSLLTPRAEMAIAKRTRWSALLLATPSAPTMTDEVFDALWAQLGGAYRYLSVARIGDAVWALLYKGDQQVVNLAEPVRTPHAILKPSGGGAARNAVATLVNAWFEASSETTSNFRIPGEEEVAVADVFHDR